MKFLLALSVLASTSVFANDFDHKIKCWDTAQEEGGKPAYVFEVDYGSPGMVGKHLDLVFPFDLDYLKSDDGCLKYYDKETEIEKFKACKTDGQHINGLIPVDIEVRNEVDYEETVYCERELKRWFFGGGDM